MALLSRSAGTRPGWPARCQHSPRIAGLSLGRHEPTVTSFVMYFLPALMQIENYAGTIMRGIERKIGPG
jgi:hypothetical protein